MPTGVSIARPMPSAIECVTRMGDDGEAAQHDLVPRPVRAQVGALEHPVLGEAMLGDGERQRRAVHGHVELAQEIRQRPDVVLVAVGQDHAAEGRAAIAEIREVGDHVVHPGHLVVREQEPAVDGDHVVARLDQHHVEPDLAQPPERDQAHRGRGRHIDRDGRRAIDGTHGGVAMVPPALGPTKKQDAGTGAICFARSTQPSPSSRAAQLDGHLRATQSGSPLAPVPEAKATELTAASPRPSRTLGRSSRPSSPP